MPALWGTTPPVTSRCKEFERGKLAQILVMKGVGGNQFAKPTVGEDGFENAVAIEGAFVEIHHEHAAGAWRRRP